MLSSANRMRKSEEFSQTIQGGVRKGNKLLVCHVVTDDNTKEADRRVGFVVAKTVGNSVVRHRVYRRLRHIMRELLPEVSASNLVIRANPPAATASSTELRDAVVKNLMKAGVLPATFRAPRISRQGSPSAQHKKDERNQEMAQIASANESEQR
ncbi:ribonuclease P protein component [Arcanobacterium canis]|uniref:Ribonuclease P protein component n=1 Tax=Arcanobacterium canis TaxID=999183 RepID=A0ABY8G0S9_9ACTO|nr:ribonuclease P protein component [Arcanobacterium canis]WFM83398.1 ribonuclease P protein component [Arcanobacterium canis]